MELFEVDHEEEAVRRLLRLYRNKYLTHYLRALVNTALAYNACPFKYDLVEFANNALEMCELIEMTESASRTLCELLADLRAEANAAKDLEKARRVRYNAQLNKKRQRVPDDDEEEDDDVRKKLKGWFRWPVP